MKFFGDKMTQLSKLIIKFKDISTFLNFRESWGIKIDEILLFTFKKSNRYCKRNTFSVVNFGCLLLKCVLELM